MEEILSRKENIFIEITLTNNCNCNCEYCFEGCHMNDRINLQEQQRQIFLLKDLIERFDTDKYEWLTISMWGGEPFLNIDYLLDIISETHTAKFVRYHIYSNGTLIDNYKKLLSQSYISSIADRLKIQLSYDGEPIHTLKRGDNKQKIFAVADMLLEHKISFSFKATLPFDQIDKLSLVWDDYHQLFLKYGNLCTYFPTLDTNNTDTTQLEIFEEQLKIIIKKEQIFIKKYGTPLFGWFNSRKSNCAIKNSIFIHNTGNIYLCHGCPYTYNSEHFKYSNTADISSLTELLNHNDINYELNSTCSTCEATYCSVCHITQITNNENPIESWSLCRTRNQERCKYFKLFGKYNKLLNYILNYSIL